MICFATQEIRLINAGIVIGVENVLTKPLSSRCPNFATVSYMFTQEKILANAVIVIGVENVYKTAVLKTHKFCHSGAKPFLQEKL